MADVPVRTRDEVTPLVNDHHPTEGGTFVPDGGLDALLERCGNSSPPSKRDRSNSDHDDENDEDDDYAGGRGLFRKRSSRSNSHRSHSHSRDNSFLHEIQEVLVDTLEEVKDTLEHGLEEFQEVLEEPLPLPVKPREEGDHDQKLSALACAVLVFYQVSGGPFGCEPAVKAAGPFYTLLGYIVFPILWCIPEALVTAELGSAFPEPSGSIAWVEEAFGPHVSLLCGYFHWVAGATDNAIYPSLFLRYVFSYVTSGTLEDGYNGGDMARFLFTIGITTVLALINYTGLEFVGNMSILICIISLSPFLIMTICAIPKLDVNRWLVMPEVGVEVDDDDGVGLLPTPMFAGVMWRPLLNSLFWNLNSFDSGATFAGEIRDPQRVFPRAMFLSIILVVVGYLLPLMAALGAVDTKQNDWEAGYFSVAANQIAGPWLGGWVVFAAAVSNVALFEAEMSGDAYQLMGMADRGLIPKIFGKRSRFGTPTNGIIAGTFVIFAVSIADFDQLVEMLNFAYSLSLLFEFSAFIKLRITDDDVERPYRIPLNTFGCIMFVLPPMIFLIYLMLIASKGTFVYLLLLLVFGFIFYLLQKFSKHYNWMEYVQAPKRKRNVKQGATSGNASVASSDNNSTSSSTQAQNP